VTARPRSRYLADLTAVNLLRGTAQRTTVNLDGGGQLTCAEPATGPVFAVIRLLRSQCTGSDQKEQQRTSGVERSAQ
jgi:hypothetical protein